MPWTDDLDTARHTKIMTTLDTRGAAHLRYAGNDRGFAAFLLVADALCRRHYAVSIFDLTDHNWRDDYDDGATPAQALRAAIATGI